MQLIYLAPLAWSSFAQRPHMFVRWFHEKYQCPVLWINPYPTRFPELKDFKRIASSPDGCATPEPEWLSILTPKSLPIEPLAGSHILHSILWQSLLTGMRDFARADSTLLVIGKPSALALECLAALRDCPSCYDAMDDYPQFYRGLSRAAFAQREKQVVRQVNLMAVSSTALLTKWSSVRADIQLVRNGLMTELFLPVEQKKLTAKSLVLGYLGTIAEWFDWAWVIALAAHLPTATIRLIGPLYTVIPEQLPDNIQLLPACDHGSAIAAMKDFDVGLIPFKQNQLTASVDPIKFYEYRALGIPVIATAFGEMLEHKKTAGTFISYSEQDIPALVAAALTHQDTTESRALFIADNSWDKRFGSLVFHAG